MRCRRSEQALLFAVAVSLFVPSAVAQQSSQITVRGIGPVRMCELLRRVKVLFPSARDTVMTGEDGTGWPSTVVSLGNGEWIIFESSWIDTAHVWRFTTNSPRYQAPSGARVGMSIKDLIDRDQALEFGYPEGYIVVTLGRDSVSFLVDDHSAAEFWTHFDFKADSVEALAVLSHDARIKELFVSGSCQR